MDNYVSLLILHVLRLSYLTKFSTSIGSKPTSFLSSMTERPACTEYSEQSREHGFPQPNIYLRVVLAQPTTRLIRTQLDHITRTLSIYSDPNLSLSRHDLIYTTFIVYVG